MVLIPCQECGHRLSDRASACPNCGCPVDKPQAELAERIDRPRRERSPFKQKGTKWTLIVYSGLFLLLAVLPALVEAIGARAAKRAYAGDPRTATLTGASWLLASVQDTVTRPSGALDFSGMFEQTFTRESSWTFLSDGRLLAGKDLTQAGDGERDYSSGLFANPDHWVWRLSGDQLLLESTFHDGKHRELSVIDLGPNRLRLNDGSRIYSLDSIPRIHVQADRTIAQRAGDAFWIALFLGASFAVLSFTQRRSLPLRRRRFWRSFVYTAPIISVLFGAAGWMTEDPGGFITIGPAFLLLGMIPGVAMAIVNGLLSAFAPLVSPSETTVLPQ
jgi:hypothetical protein